MNETLKGQMSLIGDNGTTLAENGAYLHKQLITYLGNKRSLLPWINAAIDEVRRELHKEKLDLFDAFSGSGIVSRNFKQHAKTLYTNDLETYARISSECYLSNQSNLDLKALQEVHEDLADYVEHNTDSGFIAEMYSPADDDDPKEGERVFYTKRNAQYIDTARKRIDAYPETFRCFLLAPLLSEASIHANTSGVFKGFYKDQNGIGCFGGRGKNALARICGEISVPFPLFSSYECDVSILQQDAKQAAKSIPHVDLVYLDPPYNQHPYGSNYFMLNLICDYEKPSEVSKVSGIPTTWNRSKYNKPQHAKQELFSLIEDLDCKYVLISYNSEGFIGFDEFVSFLRKNGDLRVYEKKYNAFRGSRNLRNRNLHTTEFLFLLRKK